MFNPTAIARMIALWCCALLAVLGSSSAMANNIDARLIVEQAATPGETVTLAIAMDPAPGWHGYWSNPGDAGFGMSLDWRLPDGLTAGEPAYPVPQPLLIGTLMNHVYEGPYAVLVPLRIAEGVAVGQSLPISVKADWLACTDAICVPESASLSATLPVVAAGAERATSDPRFNGWRAAMPAPLAEQGRYALANGRLRVAIPVAAAAQLANPHLFIGTDGVADYAAEQSFSRAGDWLIVETAARDGAGADGPIEAVLRLDEEGRGLAVMLRPGAVPEGGTPLTGDPASPSRMSGTAGLLLLLAAFGGGLLLNIMPCVFPVLSLKALTLARAGGDGARAEALAYTAGVMLATLALGAGLLALRAAGQEVGWAFQLQEPATVLLLLLLILAITANLAGWFEFLLPVSVERRGGSAFGTGLLAAFVATPCTGPFMAGAMGAALLLPVAEALALFAALGLGLAFPFLVIGFVPALRARMPRPGRWMTSFRKAMAVPMGLTAVALFWLCWRLGDWQLALLALAAAVPLLFILRLIGMRQHGGRGRATLAPVALGIALLAGGIAALMNPQQAVAADIIPGTRSFSEEELAKARATGRPVFVYFTADWCVTCKVNEQVAIDREEVRAAFASNDVIVLRADWTRRDAAITRFLGKHGAAGVPLYLWYAPGREARKLSQILTAGELTALPGA